VEIVTVAMFVVRVLFAMFAKKSSTEQISAMIATDVKIVANVFAVPIVTV